MKANWHNFYRWLRIVRRSDNWHNGLLWLAKYGSPREQAWLGHLMPHYKILDGFVIYDEYRVL